MRFEKILVTTDLSEASMTAFDLAAYQAKMDGSEVTLAYVLEDLLAPVFFHEYDLSGIDTVELQQKYEKDVRLKLAKLAESHFHGIKVKTHVIAKGASVASSICDYAKQSGFNLMIISAYGRGGLLSLGSTADKILRQAPCPVLVVPRPATKK